MKVKVSTKSHCNPKVDLKLKKKPHGNHKRFYQKNKLVNWQFWQNENVNFGDICNFGNCGNVLSSIDSIIHFVKSNRFNQFVCNEQFKN